MKKIIGILIALLISSQVSTVNAKPVSKINACVSTVYKSKITAQSVTNYLTSLGYIVNSVWMVEGSTNWAAITVLNGVNYQTTVYTDSVNILGHEDSQL